MRYFITGASGFLGGVLARQLRQAGHEVVALVRRPDAAPKLAELGVELRAGDLNDAESVRAAMRGADGIFHAAAWYKVGQSAMTAGPGGARGGGQERLDAYRVNVDGTRTVVEAMRDLGVPRGVYTSTVAVFGDTKGRVVDETYRTEGPFPSWYAETKWHAHYEVALPMIAAGLPLVIVQPGVIYGIGDHSPMRGVIDAYLRGRLSVVPSGMAASWGHVDDTAAGHVRAMERGRPGEAYIVAGPAHTLIEALRIAEAVTSVAAPRVLLPRALTDVLAALPFLPESLRGIGASYLGSSAKAERELGFSARPLRKGFAEVLPAHLAELRGARV
ncbi:MAG: NAD-dependent epimerase/dehydratase family protein [Candidatus Limnocylindria bacterium]